MKNTVTLSLIAFAALAVLFPEVALAQPAGGAAAPAAAAAGTTLGKGLAAIGAGMAVIGGAFGIGLVGKSALESIARQPESAGAIQINMILAAALIEGATLFAVVVGFLA